MEELGADRQTSWASRAFLHHPSSHPRQTCRKADTPSVKDEKKNPINGLVKVASLAGGVTPLGPFNP